MRLAVGEDLSRHAELSTATKLVPIELVSVLMVMVIVGPVLSG